MLIEDKKYTMKSLHINHNEGSLTKARAGLVNGTSLAKKAAPLGLENHLIIGGGQNAEFQRGKNSALEDAFEAITAAIYLDGGMESARRFVQRIFAHLCHFRSLYLSL